MRERGKSPFDKDLGTQLQMPRLVPADQNLPKPIIQTEKGEERHQKIESVLKSAQLTFVLHSSKGLNENHEI